MATFRHRPQRYIRDFVTLVTMIMIYDLFDDDPSFELVGVLRSTRRVCVTIQDCAMSTGNLEREVVCTVVQIRMPLVEIDTTFRTNIHRYRPSTMEGLDEELMVAPL